MRRVPCLMDYEVFSPYGLRYDATVSKLARLFGFAALLLSAVVLAAGSGEARSGTMTDCTPRSLSPAVLTNGAGGTIIIFVRLRNSAGHACFARGRLMLTLRDAKTHRLLRIRGNPHAATVRRPVRAGTHTIVALQWSNYCGPGKPLLLIASLGTRRSVERDNYPGARCDSADTPSQLRLFRLRG
jgi:hypothetical protein